MSLFATVRDAKDDGVKCAGCSLSSKRENRLYDVKIHICDGQSIDGSITIAVHRGCIVSAIDEAFLRSRRGAGTQQGRQ